MIAEVKVERLLRELGFCGTAGLYIKRDAASLFGIAYEGDDDTFAAAVIALGPDERLRRAVAVMAEQPDRFKESLWPPNCRLRREVRNRAGNQATDPNSNRSKRALLPVNVERAEKLERRRVKRAKRREKRILVAVEAGFDRKVAAAVERLTGRADDERRKSASNVRC